MFGDFSDSLFPNSAKLTPIHWMYHFLSRYAFSKDCSIKVLPFFIYILLLALSACQPQEKNKTRQAAEPNAGSLFVEERPEIRGWNILSANLKYAERAIYRASKYRINHLQLSHSLCMDLKDLKEEEKLKKVRYLTKLAHQEGIEEVVVWDHALYSKSYYPEQFFIEEGKINLDNPEFWKWVKEDYRKMLNRIPEVDGLVLTFIETGMRIEDQHSEQMPTAEAKLAGLVDSLSKVIIDEYDKSFIIRTFAHYPDEFEPLKRCLGLIKRKDLRVMAKVVPHDFFYTHPLNKHVADFNFPVMIEFDGGVNSTERPPWPTLPFPSTPKLPASLLP